MKKFYLCKLCLIVFGALLAAQGVSAEGLSISCGASKGYAYYFEGGVFGRAAPSDRIG